MKSKVFSWAVPVATVLALVLVSAALAQQPRCKEFRGVINAYTPQITMTMNGVSTSTGPYEVRGPWSLKLKEYGTKADFAAELNMEFSDGWVLTLGKGNFDPTGRMAHTHHIRVVDATVTPITGGFEVTGSATFTKDGGPAPATIEPSAVVIQITGGDKVEFSNLKLTFESPGSMHFGGDPLPGVVQSVEEER